VPKFPEPPPHAALVALRPAYHRLPVGSTLWRVYFRAGAYRAVWSGFRHFGPVPQARFDHHLSPPRLQDRGILYAAADGLTCLAEVFQRSRTIDRRSGQPWLAAFALQQDVRLLDLTGLWPTAAGASSALASGQRPRARRWSQAVYSAFPDIQGLWYPSSMAGNAPAAALYERAVAAVPPQPLFHRPLADPALQAPLGRIAGSLGYVLI
jgi:hypothetical protein